MQEALDFLLDNNNKVVKMSLTATSQFLGGALDLLKTFAEGNTKLTVLQKGLAIAQATINMYLAASKAYAQLGWPWGIAAAAGAIAAGAEQVYNIVSTEVETGGRFFVPGEGGSVDSTYMRVNPGEQVDVTPRGQVGYESEQRIIVKIDEQIIFDVVNKGIKSGDIYITAANL
jgi:hypothetical protein